MWPRTTTDTVAVLESPPASATRTVTVAVPTSPAAGVPENTPAADTANQDGPETLEKIRPA